MPAGYQTNPRYYPRGQHRQLPGRGRRFAAHKSHPRPQPNPSLAQIRAAQMIQRNFRKNKQMKYNKELKHMETTTQNHNLEHQTKNSTRMANGVVLYPSGFNATQKSLLQGTSDTTIVGSWIAKSYLTHKFIVDWASLTAHADLNKGMELRCRYGYICVSPHKANCSLTTASGWQTDVNAMVMRELQDSGIDENHLSFKKKSRTVKILGDFMVRPKLHFRPSDNDYDGDSGSDFAPPNNLTIKWDNKKFFSKVKTRLAATAETPPQYVQHHQWVPFVYFSSNNITANMGSLTISDSSKLYYGDS